MRVIERVVFDPTPDTCMRYAMTRLTTMAAMPASTALALRGRQYAAEDIPELTGLLMQIGEHLAQILRIGRHL